MADDWQPPETAPKDGKVFEITTVGPNQDFCVWDGSCFRDYYHKQRIPQEWPYMVAWRRVRPPAAVCNTEADSRAANGFPPEKIKVKQKAARKAVGRQMA